MKISTYTLPLPMADNEQLIIAYAEFEDESRVGVYDSETNPANKSKAEIRKVWAKRLQSAANQIMTDHALATEVQHLVVGYEVHIRQTLAVTADAVVTQGSLDPTQTVEKPSFE
jgi:hypothetical protein